MSKLQAYKREIISTLMGQTPKLKDIPHDRLDWLGINEVMTMYERTAGQDRRVMIDAMGSIVEDGEESVEILAQIVFLAANLDISEIDPDVRSLSHRPVAQEAPLEKEIRRYLAYRQMNETEMANLLQ